MNDISLSDLKVKRLTEDDRINSFCSGDIDMDDYIVIGLIILIIGGALFYIIRAKKFALIF